MNELFSKRAAVRIIAFTAALGLLIGGAALTGYKVTSKYRDSIEYRYQMSLNNLSDYVTNLRSTLEKSLYANSPARKQPLFAKLMTMSEGAKSSLSQLPVSVEQSVVIQKYLGQVGDYAFYALSKIAKDEELTEKEEENLKKLYQYACRLDDSVEDMAAAYTDGSVKLGKTITLKGNLEKNEADEVPMLDSGFREMNEGFTDYPTMIYDGPFSDHILHQKPRYLENKPEITQKQAAVTASNFAQIERGRLNFEGDTKGNLPTYNFSVGDKYITVTKAGGMIDIYRDSAYIAKTTLSYDDALKEAKKFLAQHFKEQFSESYYVIDNNICTINFAYTEDDVIYYSDLIKVGVNMQTGEIASYCATGYLMNHRDRNVKAPKISKQLAQESLSKNLKVQDCKTALIPTEGNNEVLAYEFDCTTDDNKILVYINCETGKEEQIYIVLESDNGVLVM